MKSRFNYNYHTAMEFLKLFEPCGQYSEEQLARQLGWTRQKVRYFISRLKKRNLIESTVVYSRVHPLHNLILTEKDKDFLLGMNVDSKQVKFTGKGPKKGSYTNTTMIMKRRNCRGE